MEQPPFTDREKFIILCTAINQNQMYTAWTQRQRTELLFSWREMMCPNFPREDMQYIFDKVREVIKETSQKGIDKALEDLGFKSD